MVAAGRDRPITAKRRHPENQTARIKSLDPGLRRGDESCPNAAPELATRYDNPPAMAKPSRQRPSPSAAPSAAAAGGLVASMFEPVRASFDATRRTRVERGNRREPALRQGRFYPPFLSPQERWSPAGARPGQSPPAEKATPKREQQGSLACASRRIEPAECRAPKRALAGNRRRAAAFPSFLSPNWPAGDCRVDVKPAGRVSTRPAEPAVGHRLRAGAAQGALSGGIRHKKGGRPPGRDPANHRQPKAPHRANDKDQRPWTPACAGATNRGRMPCPTRRHHSPPAMAKPSRHPPPRQNLTPDRMKQVIGRQADENHPPSQLLCRKALKQRWRSRSRIRV